MLEAKLSEAVVFKKIIEAIRDGVSDVNFEFSPSGLSLQSIDSSHVVLTMLLMRADGFESYRCDRNIPIGININSLSKIIKCAGNDDSITIRADDNGQNINFVFESKNGERVSEYELRLLDLDAECLGCDDLVFNCTIKMPSEELQRICRDLSNINEAVNITCAKESIKFYSKGDLGSGNIVLHSNNPVDKEEKEGISISMKSPVSIGVSLKHLTSFSKASTLSPNVVIQISEDAPMMVEYSLGEIGYLRFYLAPKHKDED